MIIGSRALSYSDPYSQSTVCSFGQYEVYADIRGNSLERGRQTTVRNRKRWFSGLSGAIRLRHLRKWGQHSIYSIWPLVAFQLTPKYMTLNDLEWLFRVKFCFRAGLAARLRPCDFRKIIAYKLIKIDIYCQRHKSSAGTIVSGNIRKKTLEDSAWGRALTLVLNCISDDLFLSGSWASCSKLENLPQKISIDCW